MQLRGLIGVAYAATTLFLFAIAPSIARGEETARRPNAAALAHARQAAERGLAFLETGAFVGLIAGMAAVAAVNFGAPKVSFLWHNVVGAVTVVIVGILLSGRRQATA